MEDELRVLALAELDAVYRLAYHLAWRPGEADDLVQETYLRAFKAVATYRPTPHGIRPWLFKILHNVLNTRMSADQRRREVAEELRSELLSTSPSAPALSYSLEALNWQDIDERLKAAIDALSFSLRTTFLLCAVEGLPHAQIAEVLDVPIGTVMSRLFRARAQLAIRLHGLAKERRIVSNVNGIEDSEKST